MQKPLTAIAIQFIAAGVLLAHAAAQNPPATTPPQPAKPASTQSTTGTPKSSTASKPATTTPRTGTSTTLTLKTQREKNSYALGMNIGSGLKKQGATASVDPILVSRGLRDALSGGKTAMTEDEMRAALQQLMTEVRSAQEAKSHQEGATARKDGEAFLAANKSKDGVQTLPDGLQYKVLQQGSGPKPTANDTVTVNYRGTLISGKEFDSSYKRGQPISFPVGGVIKGWTEALQLMPVGSKWQLYIPADLAYGDRGAGSDIGPGETLIFDVELLSIGEQKK
ncbi:MAG TPA: FKBP-type peptidyl-prolyl cis-trans isomerase [Candidatus Sulfotelmatobacter sp.]|nr:FKBP-type peptidyl-prolyl cis-trans isomerase [Candidatus Sulfotelmatobacter sp.]